MTEKIDFAIDYGETKDSCIIKVIGVGGGGGNAVRHMYSEGIIGVDFLACNTDKGHLSKLQVPNKLVLGESGLGAGANPDVARKLALESKEEIKKFIGDDTKMLFITAGMGKGTGTGASPVIAEIAKSMNILTIGVVTYPFRFEGHIRAKYADAGIEELSKYVDSLIVVKNQNIIKYYNNEDLDTAFGFADDVLKNAVKCVAELITVNYEHNIDFNDFKTIMKDSGRAVLGVAVANGENRVEKVVEDALSCPLLDNTSYSDAKNFLFFISYGEKEKLKISELNALTDKFDLLQSQNAQVIWGHGMDKTLGDSIKLSVIVTNFKQEEQTQNVILQNENQQEKTTDTPQFIVTEQKMTNKVLDESNSIFGDKSVETPSGVTEEMFHDDFESLTQPQQQQPQQQPSNNSGNVFQFGGDHIFQQNKEMTFEPVNETKTVEKPSVDNFPPVQTPNDVNPYNELLTDAPVTIPTQIGDPRNMPDDQFNMLVNQPAFVRNQMSKVSNPAPTVAVPSSASMYEVDDDAHDFFKDLPD